MRDWRTHVRERLQLSHIKPELQQDVVDDLAGQLDDAYREHLARGLSEADAEAAALAHVADWQELAQQIATSHRLAVPMLDRIETRAADAAIDGNRWGGLPGVTAVIGLLSDVRHGLRRLLKVPAYTATIVCTLAVCLAANAAVLILANRILLHALDVPEKERLVLVANQFPNSGGGRGEKSAPVNYFDRVDGVTSLTGQAMFGPVGRVLMIGDTAEQVRGIETTPSLFPMLRVPPALGRTFTADEGEIGNEARIILSDGFWRDRFGGDPNVIGTTIRVTGQPHIVVGVMPPGFRFFDDEASYWIPLVFPLSVNNAVANNWYHVGRMADGATVEQIQTEVDAVNEVFFARQPNLATVFREAGFHTTVTPLETALVGALGQVLYPLWGAAIVVLLIGVLNITNLTLSETLRRRRELLTRLAIGAGRWRLAMGLLLESLILAITGGLLGMGLAVVALRTLGASVRLPRVSSLDSIGVGGEVVIAVAAMALATGALIALVSMRDLWTADLAGGLQEEGRSGVSGRRTLRLRRLLVSSEVALAFVLLVGAALLLTTFRNLLQVNPGYSVSGVVSVVANLEGDRYPTGDAARQFLDRALEAIRSIPGVSAAGATTTIPFRETLRESTSFAISGGAAEARVVVPEDTESPVAEGGLLGGTPRWITISPGFFDALDVPIVRGRDLEDRDHQTDNPVAIVDQTMAQVYWPGQDPIGKRMFSPGLRNIGRNENTRWMTVVGVVPDLLLQNLSGGEAHVGTFYAPWSEVNTRAFPRTYGFVIKTAADPDVLMRTVRTRMAELDPEMALFDVQTMRERRSQSLIRQRLAMSLASAFGGVALFLSTLGVYGVLAYLVAQRTREFGIRMALGSTPGGIFRLVLTEGGVLVGVGLAIGLGASWMLGGTLASQLYGVSLGNPWLFATAAMPLFFAALAAVLVPARHATRVDPLVVLNDGRST